MRGCTSECRTAGGVAGYVWSNTNDEPREWSLRGGTWARKGGLYQTAPGFSRFLEFNSVWRTWVPQKLDTSQGREFHLNLVFKSIVVFHRMLFMSRSELFIWQGCSLCVSGGNPQCVVAPWGIKSRLWPAQSGDEQYSLNQTLDLWEESKTLWIDLSSFIREKAAYFHSPLHPKDWWTIWAAVLTHTAYGFQDRKALRLSMVWPLTSTGSPWSYKKSPFVARLS